MEIARIILEYIKVLIWPSIVLFFLFRYKQEISNILKKFRKFNLPGGASLEAFPEQLKEAKELSDKVKKEKTPRQEREKHPSIPLTEANARMLSLGLAPSPSGLELSYYRFLAEQDPNLALAGLRMEVETMLKNLAKGFKVSITERDSAGTIAIKLKERSSITSHQLELIKTIINICNAVVHGQKITTKQAEEILNIATVLTDQYISSRVLTLPDGFHRYTRLLYALPSQSVSSHRSVCR